MRVSKTTRVAALFLTVLTACGGGKSGGVEPLDTIKIQGSNLAGAEPGWHSLSVVLSPCVVDALAELDEVTLQGWRDSLCDPEVNSGGMSCDEVTVEEWHYQDTQAAGFRYEVPAGYSADTYFELGPFPTPARSQCDPYVTLLGEGWEDKPPGGGSTDGSNESQKLRAGPTVYTF